MLVFVPRKILIFQSNSDTSSRKRRVLCNECRNYILYISLKFFTLKHLKCSYMFRSLDHPQGARNVPCQNYTLKLWIHHYIYQWCGSILCVCVCVVLSAGGYADSVHIPPCSDNNAYTNTWYAATSLINIMT